MNDNLNSHDLQYQNVIVGPSYPYPNPHIIPTITQPTAQPIKFSSPKIVDSMYRSNEVFTMNDVMKKLKKINKRLKRIEDKLDS